MMIKNVVVRKLDNSPVEEDLEYWLSKSPEERVEAVDFLRRQYNGSSARLQRVVAVFKLSQR